MCSLLGSSVGCFGVLDDPDDPQAGTDGTDTNAGCFQQGMCNGVQVYCENDGAADESGGSSQNYWWVPWGTEGSLCEDGTPANSGCGPTDIHCCPNGIDNACFCRRFSVLPWDQSQPAPHGDIGPVCVGQGFPGPVDPINDWTNDSYPAIDDEIRGECSAKCEKLNGVFGSNPSPECVDAQWSGHSTRLAWDTSDGHDCVVPNKLNVPDPDGSEVPWELVGGSSTPIPLGCDLDDDCSEWFYPDIGQWVLTPGVADIIDPETRSAHYLGVESSGSELEIDMSGAGLGIDDTEPVFGMAEYTALDCGATVCPFFLANLSAYNTTDTWDIRVETVDGRKQKSFSGFQLDLLQSTLGVHNTALDIVAFAPGTLRFLVEITVDGTGIGAGTHHQIVENQDYVFAEYDAGSLELVHEFPIQSSGDATLTLTVVPDEHPPVPVHDLSSSESCDDIDGLVLDGRGLSTDPDNDVEEQVWWIDGVPCVENCIVPLGNHDVALEVRDARGAVVVSAEHALEVTGGAACPLL